MLTKIPLKKKVLVKMVQNSIPKKNSLGAYVYFPQEWSQGARVLIQIELLIKI